ncbi:MAG: peroxiredoxin family protein [Flavobacteriaceae bacterium]|nr:peroxiredoxin family protein [Flavobacteriaceae bacterium]
MKNILKSIFISTLPVVALILFIKTISNTSFHLNDVGILLSSLSIVLFFAMLFIKPVARTNKTLGFYSTAILIGLVLNLINFSFDNLFISVGLALGWLAYLTWYSSFNNRNTSFFKVGKKLPEFTLENLQKEKVTANSFQGHFKIFLFYRGNWCPLCMAQIQEIVQQYKELEKRKVDMLLVSSQPHKFTKKLAEKHQVPFHFLTDVKNKAAKQLGILHKNGLPAGFQIFGYNSDVVLPTVIITDSNDTIIFADLTDNYRVRPEPETFLKILDNYKQ